MNPNETPRQRAGRLNQQKSRGITPAGREALREAARRNRPWRFSTGPKSADGKSRSSRNATLTGHAREVMQIGRELDAMEGIVRRLCRMSPEEIIRLSRQGLI